VNCIRLIRINPIGLRMIISRTPFRISFFGGGTDYPGWYRDNGGEVLSSTIDKYCYLTCRYLPPFFEHRSRIVWSQIERVRDISEIEHPSVREILRFMEIYKGIEVHHDGDLPARSGLGSSSAFSVGFLNALCSLKGMSISKRQLATDAIFIEQEKLKENVGSQDQVATAFGGLNHITFGGEKEFKVNPVNVEDERLKSLQDHLMLVFTGFQRIASDVAAEQISRINANKSLLNQMSEIALEGVRILQGNNPIGEFGKLLHQSWELKRNLSTNISNSSIDDVYNVALASGATGGKLLGAGGGGFMLLFVDPVVRSSVSQSLQKFLQVPFAFEKLGSQIIFNDNLLS